MTRKLVQQSPYRIQSVSRKIRLQIHLQNEGLSAALRIADINIAGILACLAVYSNRAPSQ